MIIDRKDVIKNVLNMWVNSRFVGETVVLLELGYALSKLEDGIERYYYLKKQYQSVCLDNAQYNGSKNRKKKKKKKISKEFWFWDIE